MNGILLIDKPRSFTSFDVVAKLRGIARTRKIGHGGTLDPMATGVLPLFLGAATKACGFVPRQDKRYTATFRLGVATDTLDITGTVLEERPVNVGAEDVAAALRDFLGRGSQLPPMYSAVQVNGVRLYELARRGVEVERKPREAEVFALELVGRGEAAHEYTIDLHCSKGFYVRTLCGDLGRKLGCGAVLTALRRTMACGFSLDGCITLEQARRLADGGALESRVLPVSAAFEVLPRLALDTRQTRLFRNGVRMDAAEFPDAPADTMLAVWGVEGFLGLGALEKGRLAVKKLLAQREEVSV